jgi:hypothetical protein
VPFDLRVNALRKRGSTGTLHERPCQNMPASQPDGASSLIRISARLGGAGWRAAFAGGSEGPITNELVIPGLQSNFGFITIDSDRGFSPRHRTRPSLDLLTASAARSQYSSFKNAILLRQACVGPAGNGTGRGCPSWQRVAAGFRSNVESGCLTAVLARARQS